MSAPLLFGWSTGITIVNVAPAPGRALELDAAVVRLGDRLHDRRARGRSRPLATPVPAAPEALEDRRLLVLGRMPAPSSRTHSRASPPTTLEPIRIGPSPPACATAFSASWSIACVSRWRSATTMPWPRLSTIHSRGASAAAFVASSSVSVADVDGRELEEVGLLALREQEQVVDDPAHALELVGDAARRSPGARAGSSGRSSRLPSTIVSGVRSSWPASSTKRRCDSNARSSRSSISLNVAACCATSSRPSTGMRRLRSVSEIERAVRVSRVTGSTTRPGEPPGEQRADEQHAEADRARGEHGRRRSRPERGRGRSPRRRSPRGSPSTSNGHARYSTRPAGVSTRPRSGAPQRRPSARRARGPRGGGTARPGRLRTIRLAAEEGDERLVPRRDVARRGTRRRSGARRCRTACPSAGSLPRRRAAGAPPPPGSARRRSGCRAGARARCRSRRRRAPSPPRAGR